MLFGYQLPELKNIINFFRWNSLLTTEERDEIELSMGTLIDNFIEGDALGFSNPYFELNMKEYVFKNMSMSLKEVLKDKNIPTNNKAIKITKPPQKPKADSKPKPTP